MTDPGLPDAELVRLVAAGSEPALATLYDRHVHMVFGIAMRITRDPGASEEVVSEAFLVLWNRAEEFDPERGELGAWLGRITRNRAIDRRRASARRHDADPFATVTAGMPDPSATVDWLLAAARPVAAAEPEPQPDARVIADEARAAVFDAVRALPDEERLAILLAYRDGLSQSEIAARLGWPLGTVKTRSRRALRRLRAHLERVPQDAVGPAEPLEVAQLGTVARAGRSPGDPVAARSA